MSDQGENVLERAGSYVKSVRARARWRRRSLKLRLIAQVRRKADRAFDPSRPLRILGDLEPVNGLARAYRYEQDRLRKEQGPHSEDGGCNYLILGQPQSYWRMLRSPPPDFADAYRIGAWVTEFEKPPRDWRFALDIVHEIWTPSQFSAAALRRITSLPVRVIPYAVSVPDVPPMSRAAFGVPVNAYLGMAIMDLRTCPDRKNPLAHVRAWRRAFGDDPSCVLLMKVRFSKRSRFMQKMLIDEIGAARNITVTERTLSDRDMAAFQRMADVYLSLHRAEGYGLNIREMCEIGVPTIATGWSGNMDFMVDYPHAVPVPYALTPYQDRTAHYDGDGLRWAEADIDAAADALRRLRLKHVSSWNRGPGDKGVIASMVIARAEASPLAAALKKSGCGENALTVQDP